MNSYLVDEYFTLNLNHQSDELCLHREDDFFGLLRRVVSYKFTDVSEVLTALMMEAVRASKPSTGSIPGQVRDRV
jgi:hypothetical protein